jgi:hypothetical protein
MGLDRLRALVGPPSTVLTPAAAAADALAEAELSAEERLVVEHVDGQRSLAEIAAVTTLPEDPVYQIAHALVALGAARSAREPGRTAPVSAPGSWITGSADLTIDRERVRAKHAHVREADYFEVLGVRRDATAFEIRRAFEAARRDYAPESFAPDIQRELAVELAEIRQVLVEAQRVLRADDVRSAYLAHLKDPA